MEQDICECGHEITDDEYVTEKQHCVDNIYERIVIGYICRECGHVEFF